MQINKHTDMSKSDFKKPGVHQPQAVSTPGLKYGIGVFLIH